MELVVPQTWSIAPGALISALAALIAAAWLARAAYGRVMGALAEVKRDIEAIKARNSHTDLEAAATLRRHHEVEKAVAVSSAELAAIKGTVDRMERTLDGLLIEIRKGRD